MKCPKCKTQLPYDFFTRDHGMDGELRCRYCNYRIHRKVIYANMTPGDCIQVRDGIISECDFRLDESCQDCHEDCIFATSALDDTGLEQDAEGNWGYQEDL